MTVSFADGEKVTVDALVGCDGPTSSVRKLLHPECAPIYRGYTAWRGYLDKDLAPPEVISALYDYYETLGDGGIYFHVGSPESGHLVVYELPANADTGRKINLLWYVPKMMYDVALGTGKDVGRDKKSHRRPRRSRSSKCGWQQNSSGRKRSLTTSLWCPILS